MPTLSEALQSFSKTLSQSPSSKPLEQKNSASTTTGQEMSGQTSVITISAPAQSTHALTSAGIPGFAALPVGKVSALEALQEPDKVVVSATTSWLPLPIQHWLNSL